MIKSIDELDDISLKIKELLPLGGIVLLVGDLASGKTTLIKNFAKHLKLKDEVSSPTFSILNIYDDKLYHYDIYNEGVDKFLQNGLLENLELQGYHFIEWADESLEKTIKELGFLYIKIEITSLDKKREYRISYDS